MSACRRPTSPMLDARTGHNALTLTTLAGSPTLPCWNKPARTPASWWEF